MLKLTDNLLLKANGDILNTLQNMNDIKNLNEVKNKVSPEFLQILKSKIAYVLPIIIDTIKIGYKDHPIVVIITLAIVFQYVFKVVTEKIVLLLILGVITIIVLPIIMSTLTQ